MVWPAVGGVPAGRGRARFDEVGEPAAGRRLSRTGTTCELRDVNAADRADFALHRVADASRMELVAAYAQTYRSIGHESVSALTTATGAFPLGVRDEAH